MSSHKAPRVTKPRPHSRHDQLNNRSTLLSLQQSRRRLKKTLVKKLQDFNVKCVSDVYLQIGEHMGDGVVRFFTAEFTVDPQSAEGFC